MGALLLAAFFLVRFGLLGRLDREAIGRAARFAPMRGGERAAYWVYQLSTGGLLLGVLTARIRLTPSVPFWCGLLLCGAGLILLALSVIAFAAPPPDGVCRSGVYRLSRNPMYLAYFLYFLGCGLLARSPLLCGLALTLQISAHWVIRAEERWCAQCLGEPYLRYARDVPRYLGLPAKKPREETE